MSLRSDQREDGESTSGSSEAKTDRYGFLLVNGDTNNDSSDDPCLELVRHREMKWINLISQWDQVLEKKHSKIKAHCHKGIPASVRPKCWPLLCGATQRKQNNKDLYKTLESSPGQQSWIDVITRDTDRQFPFHEMFQSKDSYGQQGLLQVLKAYTQFRPDEGYCQAQGPVAAVLLMHMPMEEAFWCLVQISELYLPGYYSPLLEGVLFDAAILFGVLKRTCPAAYKHMQKQGVEPLMFATDWLMCLYTRHLPFKTLLRVWDLFFCNGVRVLFQVAVVLVRRCLGDARQRRECEGQMETLERLRSVRGRIQQEQADAFIQEVCSVPLSLAELQRQTEKELEKWRKERPNSTFDPRDRCHGYYMIWEKGKGKERENEKKERQSGKLRAPVARSYSSLSPAILRKKWRKTGSKTETEEWEGKGLTKRDSDEDERRRASVCGVAGEIQAKTPEEFSTHLQKELNTTTKPQRISATKIETFTDSNDAVFEEDQNNVVVIVVVPSKEPDPQTANIQLETGKQQDPETQKEQTSRDDQGEDISIHQNQPEGQTQQEEPQFSRLGDSRKNLEEEIQVNESKQEEETEIRTWNPEEDIQFHISTQVEDVKIIYQEVEHEVNTDIREEQRQENETNMEMDSIKQEKETHLGSTKEESVHQCDIQETKRIEHEVEIQEEKEAKSKTDKQEVELKIHLHGTKEEAMYNCDIQEKEIKTKRTEHEIETQEEEVTKSKNYNQEVEREEEQEIMANSSEPEEQILNAGEVEARNREQEIEIQEANEITANSSEYELKQEIKAKGSEQEVKILNAGEVQARNRKQEIEIQEANEITANSSEYELKKQEEQEIKANSGEQEVKIHLEKENRANCSEKEVEIEDGDKQANSANEEEKSKFCLLHTEDAPTDKKQQQEVEQTLKTEEEMHSNVQNPEDQKDAEEQAPSFQEEGRVKDDCCERGENTDVEKTQQEQESERENEELISDASGRETEETITKEENRSGVNLAADREASESVASSNIQPEMVMEQSGESETPRDSNKTQEEKKKGEKISKPEQTSNSRNPVPPQPDEKEEEVEVEINITTESNPLKVPCGANQHPQLRLRRSSSTHTSYPTILSEETFRDPQQNIKRDSCPRTTEAEASDITESKQTEPRSSKMKQKPQPQAQWKSDKPKRRGLFHRLRADTPSKSTIPKIVIQDFSEEEEKLSSKERRRRRRTQERKEKEDEKERKKLEKELEKEKTRERKKPQRGKSFQVLSRKHDGGGGDGDGERSASQGAGRKRTSYSESYF